MSLSVGHLDGSALPDVAVANRISNDVSVVFNPGGPASDEIRVAPGGTPRAVALADVNGDGAADIVVGRELSHPPLAILIGNGNGTFASPAPIGSIDAFPDAIAPGDLDADGDQDLVLASAPSGQVVVLLNNGAGVFTETSYAIGTAPSYPSDLAIGDVDADEDLDLMITASLSQHPPVLLLNAGNGMFSPADPFTPVVVDFVSAAIGDLTGDEVAQLTLLDFANSSVAVFPNDGEGAFGSPTFFPIGASTQPGGRVRLGDLDGDGHLDAVVGLFVQNPVIPVLLGDGMGGFEPADFFSAGAGISGIALCDLDADGDLDVAATAREDDRLVVLRNLTASPTSVSTSATPAGFALLPPRPNPGRAPTIAFQLPHLAQVRLSVYDLAGRLVARLVDGPRPAGLHSVQWLGTAGNGEKVAAGMYTLRMEAEWFREQRKIVLAR
ncbi:MAG TPA: FG-GAP-like repeat-containing protein [bacterium]|nr:FG-GAP-like repeat-containing protein [bacterium]